MNKYVLFAAGGVAVAGVIATGAVISNKNKSEDSNTVVKTSEATESENTTTASDSSDTTENVQTVAAISDFEFATIKDADSTYEYDESEAIEIKLSDSGSTCSDSSVQISGSTITITSEGTYVISGTLSDGQIVVNASDNDKVRLVLKDANISCTSGAAIYCESADKVIITLDENTENTLSDTSREEPTDETAVDESAVIYSKTDLSINGLGSLTINANYKDGITTKDDLKITTGNITINSVDDGIVGKDSVTISGGNITITAGGDGIKASNEEDTTKGYVHIIAGSVTINSDYDGIQAETIIYVEDGDLDITAGGGATSNTTVKDDRQGFGFKENSSSTDTESDSKKGLKAGSNIVIAGGNISLDSNDDAIHSNADITVEGGQITAASGDDGIHADSSLTLNSGTITITESYEGLESCAIEINGGTIKVTASDDGLNASSGSSTSFFGGMGGEDDGSTLVFNGGSLYVDADGDGLDSNGSITINDGIILVDGPTNDGNAGLDYGSYCKVNGGYVVIAGSSGMAESFDSDSTQACSLVMVNGSANESVTLADSDGNVILSYTPSKQYEALYFSSPEMTSGSEYTIYTGATVSGATAVFESLYTDGTVSGGSEAASYTQSSTAYSDSTGGMGGNMGGGGHTNGGSWFNSNNNSNSDSNDSSDSQTMPDMSETPSNSNGSMPEMPTDSDGNSSMPSDDMGHGGNGGSGGMFGNGNRPDKGSSDTTNSSSDNA